MNSQISAGSANPLRTFLPDTATFDTEWIETIEEQGFSLRAFRITTARFEDGPVRTYGLVGLPKGEGPFPAILHIHGGCQSVCRDSVLYNLRRGYAAMSLDWSGAPPFTQYPPSINGTDDPLTVAERAGVECSFPYLAARAARCCLALLASLEGVDADRIGVYGISWGGFITWLVNGTDAIPKCAVAIYGTGGLQAPGHIWNAPWQALSEQTRRDWMRCAEPTVYASTQRAPLLHINGTNDFFGGFDTVSQSLPAIPVDWRCDFTPNVNHGFDAGSARALEAWFDCYLRGGPSLPEMPSVRVRRNGQKTLRVETRGVADQLTLWVSCGEAPHANRCWRPYADWEQGTDGVLSCEIVVSGDTWLYVRLLDPDTGVSVSSTPVCMSMPGATAQPQSVLFDGGEYRDGWGFQMSIMPQSPASIERAVTVDENGLTTRPDYEGWPSLVYFGLSDPERRPRPGTPALLLHVEDIAQLDIHGNVDVSGGYGVTVKNPANGLLRLPLEQFRNGNGESLPDFACVGYLVVGIVPHPEAPARIRRIAWEDAPAAWGRD